VTLWSGVCDIRVRCLLYQGEVLVISGSGVGDIRERCL